MTDLSIFSQLTPKTRMATDFEQNNHNRWGVSSSGGWSAVPSLGGLHILISLNFFEYLGQNFLSFRFLVFNS